MVTKKTNIRNASIAEIRSHISAVSGMIRRHEEKTGRLKKERQMYEEVLEEKLEELRLKVGAVKKM